MTQDKIGSEFGRQPDASKNRGGIIRPTRVAASGIASTASTRVAREDGPIRLLRFSAVRERTGLSRSTIWRLERRGAFPRHRRISSNAVAWLEREVTEWILRVCG